MSNTIKRWTPVIEILDEAGSPKFATCDEDPNGAYVEYRDHKKVMEEMMKFAEWNRDYNTEHGWRESGYKCVWIKDMNAAYAYWKKEIGETND